MAASEQTDFDLARIDDYCVACEVAGAKPNRGVIALLAHPHFSAISILRLRDNYIGDVGLIALAPLLPLHMPRLRGLDLGENGIGNDGAAALCDHTVLAPTRLPELRAISLRGNSRITRVGGQRLLMAVARCEQLCHVNTVGTRITDYFERRILARCEQRSRCLSAAATEEMREFLNSFCTSTGTAGSQILSSVRLTSAHGSSKHGDDENVALRNQLHSSRSSGHNHSTSALDTRSRSGARRHSTDENGSASTCSDRDDDTDDDTDDDDDDLTLAAPATGAAAMRESFGARTDDEYSAPSRAASRPNAPSALESLLFSTTPDVAAASTTSCDDPHHGGRTSSCIELRTRRVECEPKFRDLDRVSSDFFAVIDDYVPKEIELPTTFIFPGRIDYVAAVHAPDALIAPPMPGIVGDVRACAGDGDSDPASTRAEKAPDDDDDAAAAAATQPESQGNAAQVVPPLTLAPLAGAAVGSGGAEVPSSPSSMFWSFFDSASKTPDASRCTTPRETQLTTHSGRAQQRAIGGNEHRRSRSSNCVASLHRSKPQQGQGHCEAETEGRSDGGNEGSETADREKEAAAEGGVDSTVLLLTTVPQFLGRARSFLSTRLLRYTSTAQPNATKSLVELLCDPLWTPSQPTRGVQVADYCRAKKLRFNNVTAERAVIASNAPREFVLQRIVRPSLTDKLTSGMMDVTGKLLATANQDFTCKIWDVETGRKLHTLRGHQGHLSDCAWNTPRSDRVITTSYDHTVRVWDAGSGALVHTMAGHELEVVCIAVAPSGCECVTGGMDDLAIIWDIERGREKFTLAGHQGEIVAVDYSPLGTIVVTGSMDEQLRLWNASTGECTRVLEGHSGEISQVKFNKFGNMVLSGSSDTTCRLWDVSNGDSKVLRGHTDEVVDVEFSPDGWTCASASTDKTARIWDVLTGGCLSMLVGHTDAVCRVAFTKDGKDLITSSFDHTARLWAVGTGESKQTLRGHRHIVLVFYNAATDRILTLSKDNTCRIWRLEPDTDSLFHCVAVALCQNPAIYNEFAHGNSLPPAIEAVVQRIYRKLHRTDRDMLSAPTPMPQMRSPDPDDDSLRAARSPTPAPFPVID